MIVESMNEKEIRDALYKDLDSISGEIFKKKERFRKSCLKRTIFPYEVITQITSKNNTKFYISFSAPKRGNHNSPVIGIYAIYQRNEGYYEATIIPYKGRKYISIFPPHFFRRYRERIMKEKEDIDITKIIEHHISNNWACCLTIADKDYNEVYYQFEQINLDEKIEFIGTTANGYSFGTKKNDIIIFKTIISEEMIREEQKELFNSLKDNYNDFTQDYFG